MGSYEKLKEFKKQYPRCVTWYRLKKHCQVLDMHLNPDEEVQFIMAGQLDNDQLSFFNTGILAVTNERLIVAQNKLIIGYRFSSITPDLYNDLEVESGLIWGMLTVDTIKEKVYISNLDKKSLPAIETAITSFMHNAKKQYKSRNEENHK